MEERVKKFKSIFYGLDRAHGIYKSSGESVNGKAGGQAFIKKAPVTDQLWIDHIEGKEPSLGIIPIRDDATCIWGCIDIDTYPLEHDKLIRKIRELELPLIMCRSKSGGAHVFLFTKEPVQAKLMRGKLQEWAGELGYANCEIFPKQIEIKADRGDTGNFLNLPYHNASDSFRHGYSDDGVAIDLDGFFALYDTYCTSEKDLKNIKPKRKTVLKNFNDGPPCLETLMSQGVPQGNRDNTLYQYAVYAKKKWPDDWQDKLDEFNHKYMKPPLSSKQVLKMQKQHEKKDYQYKCQDQPMCLHCSLEECKSRQFGVGGNFSSQISDLTVYKSDDSTWYLNVDGQRVVVTTEQLYNQHQFGQACMNQIIDVPTATTAAAWRRKLQQLMKDVVIIEMAHEITKAGRFETLLEQFLEDQGEAEHIDEIDMGKALFEEREYIDKIKDQKGEREVSVKKMTAYFKSDKLQKFLKKHDFKNYSPTQMAAHIRNKLGGGETRRKVKGKTTYMWYLPWIRKNSDDFKTPDMDEETPF
jgi:hypothetical protein